MRTCNTYGSGGDGGIEGNVISRLSNTVSNKAIMLVAAGSLSFIPGLFSGDSGEASAQSYTCRHIQPEQPSGCYFNFTTAARAECIRDSKAEVTREYYLRKDSCRGYLLNMGQYEEYLSDKYGIIVEENGGIYSSGARYRVQYQTRVPFFDRSGISGINDDGLYITLSFNSGKIITFLHGGPITLSNGSEIRPGVIQER